MVQAMDKQVARVCSAALERNRIADNTIVIFTSDNGGERFADVWPFSGSKMELLEGGLRIPAIVRWPGRIRPGSTCTQVAISMDWLPTLLSAAGAKQDAAYPSDGVDLMPWLTGAVQPIARRLFWRYHANGSAWRCAAAI